MVTNKQLKFRSLDDVISAASVDLRSWYSDGVIEIGELIKVVQKCNYELGLQVNQTKETVLDIEHHRTKLPNDFEFLNFAYLCFERKGVYEAPSLTKTEHVFPIAANLTTCPCWTVTATTTVQVKVIECDGSQGFRVFTSGITKTCAVSIDTATAHPVDSLTVSTNSFCYNNPDTAQFQCDAPHTCGCTDTNASCYGVDPDPFKQNKVYTICNGTVGIEVVQQCNRQVYHYTKTVPLFMEPCRRASAFSSNQNFRTGGNIAFLRDNYLEAPVDCGKVYINYQGIMEDDEGNLMILDHPIINDWVEYEVKKRILENLYLNGEPDLERRLQYIKGELRVAKRDAMIVAYTPDFKVICQTYAKERRDENEKHFYPFSRFFGWNQVSAFYDYLYNGKYRE